MNQERDKAALESAVQEVCQALQAHAAECADGGPVPSVIALAERATQAIRNYEQVLWKEGGWSNPFRHLGSRPFFRLADSTESKGGLPGISVSITVTYELQITDVDELLAMARGRTGEDVDDPEAALAMIAEEDAWDPLTLPVRGLTVNHAHVSVASVHS